MDEILHAKRNPQSIMLPTRQIEWDIGFDKMVPFIEGAILSKPST
ncbi:hypothetical protein [Staphylococcus delphini]|nr:hypothetical protein [Staphylococcus delphini]MDE9789794.1 hypothetical protein [Staphylococcus delphini]MDE9789795.1 hypothetical protein [Staphylococcus delphini]